MRYPLPLELQPSRRVRLLIAAIHLVAAIAFVLSTIERALLVPIVLLLGLSLWRALHAERQKEKWLLVLEDSGLLRLVGPGGERIGHPLPGCTDFGWAVWLSWRADKATRTHRPTPTSFMLFPDNLPRDSWRALRTWMRHKAASAVGSGASGGRRRTP